MPACPAVHNSEETPSSDSLKARHKVRTCANVWWLGGLESPLCNWPFNRYCLIDSFWSASRDDQRAIFMYVFLRKTSHSISAIATQGAVKERCWVSSYLFYGKFKENPYYPVTDDKGHIKVALIKNFLCSYLKLLSQFKEKWALRPVVNIVCSVHSRNGGITVILSSFLFLSFYYILLFTSFIFFLYKLTKLSTTH